MRFFFFWVNEPLTVMGFLFSYIFVGQSFEVCILCCKCLVGL